jgi:putative peptide zinc metalloprotease protein
MFAGDAAPAISLQGMEAPSLMVPPLREELALYPGPALADGQPSWTLHDPVQNKFFRMDWQSFEMLCRWQLAKPAAIAAAISRETTLTPQAEDVEALALFLMENQLTQAGPGSASGMAQRLQRMRGAWHTWLLHHYLFFRVPLLRSDRWLGRWAGVVAPLYTRGFAILTLLALALGLALVQRDWDHFAATLMDTFSWQGVAGYGAALVSVKVLHEFGHAFTAKRFGCRVPAMGVAFLVMFPVAYTDTNEVWKLPHRKQRLAVAGAGVLTELIVAAWATLAWTLLPEGTPKAMAFMLASTTWIATLAINSSPFMRFDGYFLLSDWLDIPNLHSRSFALARWHMREKLFGLGLEPPEYFSRKLTFGLILFAYATWVYRLVLFLGIAALVYHFFIKAVGIFLFMVEIGWFVLLPLRHEIRLWPALLLGEARSASRWRNARAMLGRNARTRRSALLALALIVLVAVPWPTRLTASGMLKPLQSYTVYAPAGAQIASLPWPDGARVKAGDVMLELASPELQLRWRRAEARLLAVRRQADNTGVDAEQRQNIQVLQQEENTARAELANVQADLALYAPKAPFGGVLRRVDVEQKPGVWVSSHERLAVLFDPAQWQVETYLDEDAVRRVRVGDSAHFYADGQEGPSLALRVSAIEQDATRQLSTPMLSAQAGGSVLTRTRRDQLLPELAVYRVTLRSEAPPGRAAGQSWRGHVVISGEWEAPGLSFARAALVLVWREMGF